MKKILIINPFGIGDVLFTTPLIHTLKDAFYGVKISYLCNSRGSAILENNPYIDNIFIYDRDEFEALRKKSSSAWLKRLISFFSRIKREDFALALDFSLNTQFGFFCWFAGIRERVGFDFKKRGRFLTKRIKLSGYSHRHIVEYYAQLLKFLGLELKYSKLELYLKKEDIRRVEEILSKAGLLESYLVGIIPGAGRSWGKDAYLKRWPAENFAQLADKIIEESQAEVIIMGDSSEKLIAEKIIKNMRHKPLDLSGLTSIGELAALLNKVRLLITNDGGPLHMAVALGIKTVSVFGPVDERVYGPYPASPQHIVIKNDLLCRPCYQNFKMPECQKNRDCIMAIRVDEVFEGVRRLW